MCYQLSDYRCESILLLKILLFYIAYFTLSSADWTSHPNLFGVEFRMRFHITCRLKSSVSDWSSGLTGLQNRTKFIIIPSQVHPHRHPPVLVNSSLHSTYFIIFLFLPILLSNSFNFFFQFKLFLILFPQ